MVYMTKSEWQIIRRALDALMDTDPSPSVEGVRELVDVVLDNMNEPT
jgi:hypothetical protein